MDKKKDIWHGASFRFRSNLCDVQKGEKKSRTEGRHKPKRRGENGVEGVASAAQGRARVGGREEWVREVIKVPARGAGYD